jgi:hypothetical protein
MYCQKCGGPLNIDCTAPYCPNCNRPTTITFNPVWSRIVINGVEYGPADIAAMQAENKRLTEHIAFIEALTGLNQSTTEQAVKQYGELVEKYKADLAELDAYRQAEKDGTLVRVPCKVGDTVWVIESDYARPNPNYTIETVRVDGIRTLKCENKEYRMFPCYSDICGNLRQIHGNFIKGIDACYFTLEAAESALSALKP